MAATTIGWVSSVLPDGTVRPGYTYNPWWGCSGPAGAGCDNCYAARLDKRTGGNHFGVGTTPRLTKEQYRNLPFKWNREAETDGIRTRVFAGSMMDVFDKNAPAGARESLWETIRATSCLDWQLLTKRPSNITRMLPSDWGAGYDNVWLGVTVENRRSGLRRLEQLRKIPARVRFLSIEPLLEDLGEMDLTGIDLAIVGGESGPGCRPMDVAWVRNIRRQCKEQGVAFFYKQRGGHPVKDDCLLDGVEVKEWPKTALPLLMAA